MRIYYETLFEWTPLFYVDKYYDFTTHQKNTNTEETARNLFETVMFLSCLTIGFCSPLYSDYQT